MVFSTYPQFLPALLKQHGLDNGVILGPLLNLVKIATLVCHSGPRRNLPLPRVQLIDVGRDVGRALHRLAQHVDAMV